MTLPCYENCDGIMIDTPFDSNDAKYNKYLKMFNIRGKYVCNKCGAIMYGEKVANDNNTDQQT